MQQLNVTPGRDFMLFFVESSSGRHPDHIVNLLANTGNGACDCADFAFHCQSHINEQMKKYDGKFYRIDYWLIGTDEQDRPTVRVNPGRTRCKHCDAAIKYWADRTLKDLSEHDES